MRIALISTPFVSAPPLDYGGTELVVYELAEGLVEQGHHVTLFGTGDSTTSAELRALFPKAQWPPNTLTDVQHVSWALQQIAQQHYDLVHANSAVALALARLVSVSPLVYTIHHNRNEVLSRFYTSFPEVYYVAISADQQSREVPLERVTVIHHGLDPNRYRAVERASDYVCFVGRFSPEKAPHLAIEAAHNANVPIRIAGRTHAPDTPYAAAELEPRLRWPEVEAEGPVGMTEKTALLTEARALLAPVQWDEPFGLILVEAMLSGCPVVAFRRGSIPELIEPGETGFIVDSMDEMADAIRPGGPVDGIDRRRCRSRAVIRFSRQRMVRDYERLYQRVLWESKPHLPVTA
jgi:glycosyltransferase involved in cell wall biosynthesis